MNGFISQETIDAVINTVDIVKVISEYTKLDPKGNDYWGCCPFHGEKTASFHVDPDKKFYHCFGCGAGGNVVKFIMEQEKVGFGEAIEFLAKKNGIEVKYQEGYNKKIDPEIKLADEYIELYERTATMFHYLLTETEQGKKAYKYITDRGLTADTIKKFKLGFAPSDRHWLKSFLLKKNFSNDFLLKSGLFSKNYPDIAFFSDRLMFPIFNRQGQVVAFGGRQLTANPNSPKYLNSGDLIQYKKGSTLYAFNFAKKSIKDNKKVIFCEGYMDCIAYHQCGIEYAVAPLGTALTEEQIKIVRPFVKEVLLSFDSDSAGQKATFRAILMLRKADITAKVIKIEGGKDPAELMVNFGKDILTKAVSSAILDVDFLLTRLGSEYPIDTPEGKTRAALDFFPYLDALQSDIYKESCIDQLCQAFNLKPEAVKRDYNNRNEARQRLNIKQPAESKVPTQKIKLTAELRGVLAVVAEPDKYRLLRNEFSSDTLDDFIAKKLYSILEDCYKEDSLSLTNVLNHCDDKSLLELITSTISGGEFKENNDDTINSLILLLRRKKLEKYRDKLMNRIRNFSVVTTEDNEEFNKLLSEKLELDKKLKL